MDLKDIAQSILAGLGGPWLDQAKGQMAKDISAYQSGGVPALMANTQGTADLAGGFGGNTKAVGIRAYHGSPYDFDKFDLSKIGTGEGAQAYGHGLYFAENPKVAQEYRDALANPGMTDAAEHFLKLAGNNKEDALRLVDEAIRKEGKDYGRYSYYGRIREQLRGYSPGKIYEVNINAKPEQFLDWDKPLAQQPVSVIDPLRETVHREAYNRALAATDRKRADELWGMVKDPLRAPAGFAQPLLKTPEVTRRLNEAGIPGIRYLDQGSRTGGQGTSNYVVFNPDIVEILKKYGIVAAPAAGALMPPEQQAPVF